MKTILILSTFLLSLFTTNTFAKDSLTKASFIVYGNCGMCKSKIETAAKVKGVANVTWSEETHILTVAYAPAKITLDEIQQNIAKAGYDTDKFKANDKDYKNLHQCCQYDRVK